MDMGDTPKKADLEITHVRASGPGGQNRNKRMSGIRMRHVATGVTVSATERRSQKQNLDKAYERITDVLQARAHKPKPRKKTKRSRGAVERRLAAKQLRGKRKQERSGGGWE